MEACLSAVNSDTMHPLSQHDIERTCPPTYCMHLHWIHPTTKFSGSPCFCHNKHNHKDPLVVEWSGEIKKDVHGNDSANLIGDNRIRWAMIGATRGGSSHGGDAATEEGKNKVAKKNAGLLNQHDNPHNSLPSGLYAFSPQEGKEIEIRDSNSAKLKVVVGKSIARRHLPKSCKREGCNNQARRGGLCCRHGGKPRKCNVEGCTTLAQREGLCCKHGKSNIRKICSHEGCNWLAKKKGICITHGAVVVKCKHGGCNKYSKKGGFCIAHGEI